MWATRRILTHYYRVARALLEDEVKVVFHGTESLEKYCQNNLQDFSMNSAGIAFEKLVAILAKLRDPNGGCPWDLEQTHETLTPYMIEEAYEVVDAIKQKSNLKEELGDVLLQVVLHSQIASEAGTFDITKVVEAISEKMIRRHPHVFGDTKVANSTDVLENWEQIKKKELPKDKSVIDGVPQSMPALLRAQRIGEKAARIGFEWRGVEDVRDKVFEEIREFLEESCNPKIDQEHLREEFGDVLFALTQLSRRLNLNSEELLQQATNKFSRRFKRMEQIAGSEMKSMGLEKLDKIWDQVKLEERGEKTSEK